MLSEQNFEVLARSEWLDALRDLSICCADDDPCDAEDRVRELNALLGMVPDEALSHGLRPIRAVRLEELLGVGACENAVMAMFEDGSGFLVSRSGDGHSLATIALPGSIHERSGAGATPALALVGAVALFLSNANALRRAPVRHSKVAVRPALH